MREKIGREGEKEGYIGTERNASVPLADFGVLYFFTSLLKNCLTCAGCVDGIFKQLSRAHLQRELYHDLSSKKSCVIQK